MRATIPLAMALVLVAAAPARADRFARGEALFKQHCAACHTVGWGSPLRPPAGPSKQAAVDLTTVTQRLDGTALRRFLATPDKERPGTACRHHDLARQPVDDLVAFLIAHAGDPPPAQVTPPRSRMRRFDEPKAPPATRGGAR